MEFTINSKQKKVELFYESEKEQAAIMDFISKWLTFKEDKINWQPNYRESEIAWASNSASRSVSDSLTGHAYANVTNTLGTINAVGSAIKVDDTIDSRITVSEDIPSNCIHVSAKSR